MDRIHAYFLIQFSCDFVTGKSQESVYLHGRVGTQFQLAYDDLACSVLRRKFHGCGLVGMQSKQALFIFTLQRE